MSVVLFTIENNTHLAIKVFLRARYISINDGGETDGIGGEKGGD